ncbi:MAG: hypothetical protein M3450_07990 [Actinomycetota bacterium]|nr:hypothetical protein [Actinomycetota bacterium]
MTPAAAPLPVTYHGSLYEPQRYPDVKDPSIVFDGHVWHLFGTGCGLPGGAEIFHCTAPAIDGPWREEPPPTLFGADSIRHRCAPGVVAEGDKLHLFLQHEFNVLGGHIEHLVSNDGGATFVRTRTALRSNARRSEAGVYDPDASEIAGRRYLTYAAMSVVGQPDLYLAASRSGSWNGPWTRLGCILDHARVPCHNQLGTEDYEWGLEGPQLLELPGGGVLLTAVCFLPGRPAGHRQRLLMAVAEEAIGPYVVLGAPVQPSGPQGAGENGHATAVLGQDGLVHFVYQERAGDGLPWRVLRATARPEAITAALVDAKPSERATVKADLDSLALPA